jgi:hypothetical protein
VFEHKRPLYAFILVSVICAVVVGTTLRSQAILGLVQPWSGTSGIVAGKVFAPAEASEPSPYAPSNPATTDQLDPPRHGVDAPPAKNGTAKHLAHVGHGRHHSGANLSHPGSRHQPNTADQPGSQGHHNQPTDPGDGDDQDNDGNQSDPADQGHEDDGWRVDPDTTSEITQLVIPDLPAGSPSAQTSVQTGVQLDD